jgi:hypothetical protein
MIDSIRSNVGCVVPEGNASPTWWMDDMLVVPERNASPTWWMMRWPKAAAHPTLGILFGIHRSTINQTNALPAPEWLD